MANRKKSKGRRVLGRQTNEIPDAIELIEFRGTQTIVTLTCTEFTSRCPVTGQPDFGSIVIEYAPREYLIETKSLKLWLMRYRDARAFNEVLTNEIADALFDAVQPEWLRVRGCFNVRGGIQPTAIATRGKV